MDEGFCAAEDGSAGAAEAVGLKEVEELPDGTIDTAVAASSTTDAEV